VATTPLVGDGLLRLVPVRDLTVVGWRGEQFTLQLGGDAADPMLDAVAGSGEVIGSVPLTGASGGSGSGNAQSGNPIPGAHRMS
jgi:hypothetical protein